MPWIAINMLEGRSAEKKRALHERVAPLVAEILEIPLDKVKIQLVEMPFEHYSQGGESPKKK